MVRPRKIRKIAQEPKCDDFVPIINFCLDNVFLTKEELEALRLKDLEGLEQKEAAMKMGISQPTLHRLLLGARKKVSDALVNAKELKIR